MPPAPGHAAPGAKRSWVRQQFYDYPVSDGTQWYGTASSGKMKVYCVKCFDAGFNELKTREHSEVSQNIQQHARTEAELRLYSMWFSVMWTSKLSLNTCTSVDLRSEQGQHP